VLLTQYKDVPAIFFKSEDTISNQDELSKENTEFSVVKEKGWLSTKIFDKQF